MGAYDTLLSQIRRVSLRMYEHLRPSNFMPSEDFERVYTETYQKLCEFRKKRAQGAFAHPTWAQFEKRIAEVNDRLRPNFLKESSIRETFYRVMAFEYPPTRHEAVLMQLKKSNHVLEYVRSDQCETNVGGTIRDCRPYNISSNSAELLCQIDLLQRKELVRERIVEFGAGYGAAARHFIQMYNTKMYAIIDLGEVLHLSYVFLKMTVKDRPVIWLDSPTEASVREAALHEKSVVLIPRETLTRESAVLAPLIRNGMFYASFSLSESDFETIDTIQSSILRHMGSAAIFCQANGNAFHSENKIRNALQSEYSHTASERYFYGDCWTLTAWNESQ